MENQSNNVKALTYQEVLESLAEGKDIKEFPLAGLIDAAYQLREEIKPLASEINSMKESQKVIESAIISAMEAASTEEQPLLLAGGLTATATYTTTEVANVEDWSQVEKFIYENKAFHLFERRISARSWREEKAMLPEGQIPGISSFDKVSISLRKR